MDRGKQGLEENWFGGFCSIETKDDRGYRELKERSRWIQVIFWRSDSKVHTKSELDVQREGEEELEDKLERDAGAVY